ncbi:NYN domain-containing protein [Bradyrhizobium sp. RDM4]|uniref:LabA-like NYN domain-containing protein n=1 Tax=Bradyrhizobium sp. RDM4 TaxID=3378765 RepID=UPI0038FC4AFF
MSSTEKIALFIDGPNLYATSKALGFDIDYRRLLSEFQGRVALRAFYYTTVIEDQEYSSIRPLIDWLDYNGYTVVTKPTKEFVDTTTGRRKVKGSMDVDLAVNAMELAEHVDQIVLFSGDGDFRSLVESVQRRGVRVTVVSTLVTQPPMVADELRRQADVFIDLAELKPKVGRDPTKLGSRELRQQPQQFLAHGTINRADRVE